MKNLLWIGGAAAALLYFLRQKRAAGENLRVEPVDIAIDSQRSASSFWTRIYYNVKLKLINAERASVNISGINLNVFVNNTPFGSINNTTGFIVNAGSERIVNLEASFSSLGVIEAIRDLIADGIRFNVVVSGYVDTDLGRIKVQFSKNIGGSGIGAVDKDTYVFYGHFMLLQEWKPVYVKNNIYYYKSYNPVEYHLIGNQKEIKEMGIRIYKNKN